MAHAATPPSRDTLLRAPDMLLTGLWFGLLAGVLEGLITFTWIRLGGDLPFGPHILWLPAVMDVLWLLVPTLLALLLVLVIRRPWAERLALFGLAFSAALCVLFVFSIRLHTYALIVLAVGVGLQASRLILAHRAGFRRLVLWSAPALVFLVLLLAGGVYGWRSWAERRDTARLPAPAPGAPNVLLLILDTARSLSMSLDGYPAPTSPEIAAFAREGVHFRRAWSPSSWTLPSHASMFTGYYPHQLSTGFKTPLDQAQRTLAEELAAHGYATAGFVANLHYTSRGYGLARGFVHYEDYSVSPGEMFLNSSLGRYLSIRRDFRELIGFYDIFGRKHAGVVNRELLDWLHGRNPDRPFFAFLNYYDAHEPYMPPPEWDRRFASKTPRRPYLTDQSIRGARALKKLRMTPAQIQREHEAYIAGLAFLDHEIGKLLDSLRAMGLDSNTIVIITSDHGEQFGEHGYFVHNNSLYRPVMKVPLAIRFPGRIPAGVQVNHRVNLRDLSATVLDLLGIRPTTEFPGKSLARYWAGPDGAADEPLLFEVITSGKPIGEVEELRSLLWQGAEYIRHESGREEMYEIDKDTAEADNLALDPAHQAQLVLMRAAMDSILAVTGEDRWGP